MRIALWASKNGTNPPVVAQIFIHPETLLAPMTSDDFGLVFGLIVWILGIYSISRLTYLAWFDYPNFWDKSYGKWYPQSLKREAPDWFQSALVELLYKLIFPVFWLIWMGIPILIIKSVAQGN